MIYVFSNNEQDDYMVVDILEGPPDIDTNALSNTFLAMWDNHGLKKSDFPRHPVTFKGRIMEKPQREYLQAVYLWRSQQPWAYTPEELLAFRPSGWTEDTERELERAYDGYGSNKQALFLRWLKQEHGFKDVEWVLGDMPE